MMDWTTPSTTYNVSAPLRYRRYGLANLVFNTRVFTLGVLPDEDGVDIFVRSLEALDGNTGTNVREQVEGPTEC